MVFSFHCVSNIQGRQSCAAKEVSGCGAAVSDDGKTNARYSEKLTSKQKITVVESAFGSLGRRSEATMQEFFSQFEEERQEEETRSVKTKSSEGQKRERDTTDNDVSPPERNTKGPSDPASKKSKTTEKATQVVEASKDEEERLDEGEEDDHPGWHLQQIKVALNEAKKNISLRRIFGETSPNNRS